MGMNQPITRNRIDTHGDGGSSGREVSMTITAAPIGRSPKGGMPAETVTQRPCVSPCVPSYGAAMTTSAHAVIKAIEARRPDQSAARKQLLLFFCQGHYLANNNGPLFTEPMYATAAGVRVRLDSDPGAETLGNRALGFVGYVLRRYADLTDADLQSLVRISAAWQSARAKPEDPLIEWAMLTAWFRRPEELAGKPTAEEAAEFAERRKARMGG